MSLIVQPASQQTHSETLQEKPLQKFLSRLKTKLRLSQAAETAGLFTQTSSVNLEFLTIKTTTAYWNWRRNPNQPQLIEKTPRSLHPNYNMKPVPAHEQVLELNQKYHNTLD